MTRLSGIELMVFGEERALLKNRRAFEKLKQERIKVESGKKDESHSRSSGEKSKPEFKRLKSCTKKKVQSARAA